MFKNKTTNIFVTKCLKIRSTINNKLDNYYQYHFENSLCFISTTYQFVSNRLNIKNNYCKLLLFRRYYLYNTIGSGTICYMLLCSNGMPIIYEYVQLSQVLPSSVQRFLHLGRHKQWLSHGRGKQFKNDILLLENHCQ